MKRDQLSQLKRAAQQAGLTYVRIFGSGAKELKFARDVDLVVNGKKINFSHYSALIGSFEKVFNKPVDLIFLRRGLSPRLVLEVAATSKPLWEGPRGREDYAV